MTTGEAPLGRRRGGIRRHGQGWQARVSAGFDPSTGERIVLYETVPIADASTKSGRERAEREAYKEAEKVLTRLQADADALKVGRSKATVGALLKRWMEQHEIDPTTRMTYEARIRLYIEPRLGDVPLVLFVREAAQRLEPFYAQLRRCRGLCNGKPFIEKHLAAGSHDCAEAGCGCTSASPMRRRACARSTPSSPAPVLRLFAGDGSASIRCRRSGHPPSRAHSPAHQRASKWHASSKRRGRPRPSGVSTSGSRRCSGPDAARSWHCSGEDIDLYTGVVRLDENYVRIAEGMLGQVPGRGVWAAIG